MIGLWQPPRHSGGAGRRREDMIVRVDGRTADDRPSAGVPHVAAGAVQVARTDVRAGIVVEVEVVGAWLEPGDRAQRRRVAERAGVVVVAGLEDRDAVRARRRRRLERGHRAAQVVRVVRIGDLDAGVAALRRRHGLRARAGGSQLAGVESHRPGDVAVGVHAAVHLEGVGRGQWAVERDDGVARLVRVVDRDRRALHPGARLAGALDEGRGRSHRARRRVEAVEPELVGPAGTDVVAEAPDPVEAVVEGAFCGVAGKPLTRAEVVDRDVRRSVRRVRRPGDLAQRHRGAQAAVAPGQHGTDDQGDGGDHHDRDDEDRPVIPPDAGTVDPVGCHDCLRCPVRVAL